MSQLLRPHLLVQSHQSLPRMGYRLPSPVSIQFLLKLACWPIFQLLVGRFGTCIVLHGRRRVIGWLMWGQPSRLTLLQAP